MHRHYAVNVELCDAFCRCGAMSSEFPARGFEYKYPIAVPFYQCCATDSADCTDRILNLEGINGAAVVAQRCRTPSDQP